MKTRLDAALRGGRRAIWVGLLLGLGAGLGCSPKEAGGDSQTNWLKSCTGDAECGDLSCVCQHCVKPCTVATDCSVELESATCQPATALAVQTLCQGATSPSAICLASCSEQLPCPDTQLCIAGACAPALPIPDSGGTAPGTASGDFCPRLYEALCSHLERCGCDAAAAARCRTFATQTCAGPSPWGAYDQAIADGGMIYHRETVAAALAPLFDPNAPCQAPFIDLGWDSVQAATLGGVLTGTRALGSACSVPAGLKGGAHDCQPGLTCSGADAQSAHCVALVGASGACDTSAEPTSLCFLERPPDVDNEFARAFDLLSCVPDAPGSATGTCRQNLEDGLPCKVDASCLSGRCAYDATLGSSQCAAKLADSQACTTSTDCASGACASSSGAVCSAPLTDGQPCGYDDQNCQSGSCNAPDNQTSGSSPGVCGPKLDLAVGQACTQGYECATGVCRSNLCWQPICKAF